MYYRRRRSEASALADSEDEEEEEEAVQEVELKPKKKAIKLVLCISVCPRSHLMSFSGKQKKGEEPDDEEDEAVKPAKRKMASYISSIFYIICLY